MVPNANARHFLIKAKQRDLIAACGGIERAAAICGYSKSEVGRWNNADSPDWIALPAVFALEEECGRYDVSEAICAGRGRAFADAEIFVSDNGCIMSHHAETIVQMGELMSASAMAFADGKLTPAEAQQIDRSAAKLERGIAELRKATAKVRADGGFRVVVGGEG